MDYSREIIDESKKMMEYERKKIEKCNFYIKKCIDNNLYKRFRFFILQKRLSQLDYMIYRSIYIKVDDKKADELTKIYLKETRNILIEMIDVAEKAVESKLINRNGYVKIYSMMKKKYFS